MSNNLYYQWIRTKYRKYIFLQELDTFLRENNLQLDIYETNPHYAIRSAFEYWLSNNRDDIDADTWKDAFYIFFNQNKNNEFYFSNGYKKIYIEDLKDCIDGLVYYIQNNHEDFIPRIKSAIDYYRKTEDKEAFDAHVVSKYIYHIENTVYDMLSEKSLPIHIEKEIKYRDETISISKYGDIYTVDDFFQGLIMLFWEHLPITQAVEDEEHYFYKFKDKIARKYAIQDLYPKTYGLINNALEMIFSGKNEVRVPKNAFHKALKFADMYIESSKEFTLVGLEILLYNKLKDIVNTSFSFQCFIAIQTALTYLREIDGYKELAHMEQAALDGQLLGAFKKESEQYLPLTDEELHARAEEFIKNNLRSFINPELENNIVKLTCKELGITQKELAQKLDVPQPTMARWQGGEIPKMAKLALELLLENQELKNDMKILKQAHNILNKG